MKKDNFIDWEIIEKSFENNIKSEEEDLLTRWLSESESHKDFYYSALKGGQTDPVNGLNNEQLDSVRKVLMNKIFVRERNRRNFRRLFRVAASLTIPIILAITLLIFNNPFKNDELQPPLDFGPGTSKAILVLENGSIINLSSDSTIKEGVTRIVNHNKQLVYQTSLIPADIKATEEIVKNKLIIPRGGEYVIILSDGTKVWLNSDSYLEYPIKFVGETREVSIIGEGYFEVVKNDKIPFIVKTEDFNVRVLGTSFNINSYKDMNRSDITVETGLVDVIRPSGKITRVNKHQQLIVNRLTNEQSLEIVDAGAALSWKNGFFYFDKEPLDNIIKKISRWYDVNTVITSDSLSKMRFVGEIIKYGNASEVLEMLSLTGEIKYEILNDKIVISPKNSK